MNDRKEPRLVLALTLLLAIASCSDPDVGCWEECEETGLVVAAQVDEVCLHACQIADGTCMADDPSPEDSGAERECARACPFSEDELSCLSHLTCGQDATVCFEE